MKTRLSMPTGFNPENSYLYPPESTQDNKRMKTRYPLLQFTHSASGTKLRKQLFENNESIKTVDYQGDFQYENGVLQFIAQPEGYIYKDATGYRYVYQYKDHLGNNRLSFMRNAGTVAIVKETNYYPFGLTHKGYNNITTSLGSAGAKKYLYNGKELQDDYGLDWYDYGARFYDASLGRWFVVDPLAEDNHYEWTPYSYVYNNPIRLSDLFGLDSIDAVALKEAAENAVKKVTQKYGTESAQCNRGVNYAFKELTGSDEFDGMTANQMVDHMVSSKDFVKVKQEDSQDLQNDGKVVIAGKKEEAESGHVVLGVPGKEEDSGTWNGKVPQVMDTGKGRRSPKQKISRSWNSGAKDKVNYYKYKGSTYTSNTYSGQTLSTVTIRAKGYLRIKPKTIIINTIVPNIN